MGRPFRLLSSPISAEPATLAPASSDAYNSAGYARPVVRLQQMAATRSGHSTPRGSAPVLDAPALGRQVRATDRFLTLEAGAYLGLSLLGLAARLIAAAGAPLTPAEAAQALPAYYLSQGHAGALASLGATSPALTTLQALAFAVFGANDIWARLPVILLTSLYPFAFYLARPPERRGAALAAATLLFISPTWLALGSQGLANELCAVALLFAIAFVARSVTGQDRRWVLAGGVCAGLALAASPEFWSALLVGLLLWLVFRPRPASPVPADSRRFLVALPLSAFVFATAATLNPLGLQAATDQVTAWLVSFYHREPAVLARQALLLVAYEPLLLILGLGTVALVPPDTRWRKALYTAAAALLLIALASGRQMAGLALLLPPLALLGGEATIALARRANAVERPMLTQALAATAVLAVYAYISVSGFAARGELAFVVLALTALGIGLALLGLVAVRRGLAVSLTFAAIAMLTIIGLYGAGSALQGNWFRRTRASELLRAEVSRANLADLLTDVSRLSWSRTGDGRELPITIERAAGPARGLVLAGHALRHLGRRHARRRHHRGHRHRRWRCSGAGEHLRRPRLPCE